MDRNRDDEPQSAFLAQIPLEEGARGPIQAALEAGGVDNVTVVVAHLEETE